MPTTISRAQLSSFCLLTLLLPFIFPSAGQAQLPSPALYGTGTWDSDSLGNHRIVLEVVGPAPVVRADIPWRRRDRNPEQKDVIIIDATTGSRVLNAQWARINREAGTVVFQPSTAPGRYYVYYLLYLPQGSKNYPKGGYQPFRETASDEWLASIASLPTGSLPSARVVQFQSIDAFNSFYPMEVIATGAEVHSMVQSRSDRDYLLFPETRSRSIRMTTDLPYHWAASGPPDAFDGEADRGEFYVFQVGVYAARGGATIRNVAMTDLRSDDGALIPASGFSSFNTGGRDWKGSLFSRPLVVEQGRIQPLWLGIPVGSDVKPGMYRGSVTVAPDGKPPQSIQLSLKVSGRVVGAHGDNTPGRFSRLRWLDSDLAQDDSLIKPFTPVRREGKTLRILGRSVTLTEPGLPEQILSTFTPEVTAVDGAPRTILSGPVSLLIVDTGGSTVPWKQTRLRFEPGAPGVQRWSSRSEAGDFDVTLNGKLECDGFADFEIVLQARTRTSVRDVRLEIPLDAAIARYVMGLGLKGGYRPDTLDWRWQHNRNQDALWIGDVNAGIQCSFRDSNYERPLNTNFYLSRPLNLPPSWHNGGSGGIRFEEGPEGTVRLRAYGGPRNVDAGERLHFNFSLLITPFKPLATDEQWDTRYYHRFAPVEEVLAQGANTINVHHATDINPYLNYPFMRPEAMKAYVDSAHDRGCRVKIYYTVRELSNRAPELFMLRSLGDEVLARGPGGGFSWLREHLDSSYIAAWFVPELKDAAVINSGVSRWHNYYVEGLDWLARTAGIDGLYIDDVAFDRNTMKRVRKILDRRRPRALIDLHSANQFNPRDGFASSANLYLEHFPYLDRLWFGEYFDYDARPDYWLVEISGIPFGLMGEMLEKGGNPWRGMVYGMTARLPWAGDPTQVWKAWDDFGMAGTRMAGYWSPRNPVRTGNPEILATAYVKPGKALVAIASWASDSARCALAFDWNALGLDKRRVTMRAPAIPGFQPERTFRPGDNVPVNPGKGWIIILEERQ